MEPLRSYPQAEQYEPDLSKTFSLSNNSMQRKRGTGRLPELDAYLDEEDWGLALRHPSGSMIPYCYSMGETANRWLVQKSERLEQAIEERGSRGCSFRSGEALANLHAELIDTQYDRHGDQHHGADTRVIERTPIQLDVESDPRASHEA